MRMETRRCKKEEQENEMRKEKRELGRKMKGRLNENSESKKKRRERNCKKQLEKCHFPQKI